MKTLRSVYEKNPCLLGSARMIAFYEQLSNVPYEDRKVSPPMGPISVTVDGFMIAAGAFLGAVSELEENMYRLCEHFGLPQSEADSLLNFDLDYRSL